MKIAPGFHVNTNRPQADFIATQLFVTPAPAAIDYPSGESLHLAFADQPLSVYTGDIGIAVQFPEPVKSRLRISLQYQACDDSAASAGDETSRSVAAVIAGSGRSI